MEFKFRNVNDAFWGLVEGIHHGKIPTETESSRAGDVLRVPGPVMVTYTHPRERVLFNAARDCNHFFHLFESLWMLAGRNDVEPLVYYNPRMREYSDDGKTLHGAYGHRWREAPLYSVDGCTAADQLQHIANNLKSDPNSRREVLQIWDTERDLASRVGGEKDLPCNTHAYFTIRCNSPHPDPRGFCYLDMTVCNRSNDLIWGMLGANVVHFSFLQEYLAARIGVEVGVYRQFTNNLHVYAEPWGELAEVNNEHVDSLGPNYPAMHTPFPLVENPSRFDRECKTIVDCVDGREFKEPFLRDVAQPMLLAFRAHKRRSYLGDHGALAIVSRVADPAWRIAAEAWLKRRYNAWTTRQQAKLTATTTCPTCGATHKAKEESNGQATRGQDRVSPARPDEG